MTTADAPTPDPLDDFDRREFSFDGITRHVLVGGTGPAVIVMPEMPGISPEVARFGRWVRDAGFTTWMPSLFGRDGVVASVDDAVAVFKRTCISAEFTALADGRSTPIVSWLRQLAEHAHARCGGPGVGAVGMCFTGNFAVSLMLGSPVVAPVMCQPSLPLDEPGGTGIAPQDMAIVKQRLESEDLSVLGLRFDGDHWCTARRFAAFREGLGERFVARVLPDSAANPNPPPFFKHVVASPHSVVTAHLIDEAGQPTVRARDEILAFLHRRLTPAAAVAPH